ncbi:hypothetical protein RclHR1_23600003 [Rhizophagus clarus]|uniref:Kinase-like domain-containing protein n=1 Tax=Rhizophagus clarus TaxID=94130 RepID=A0A2Z6RQL5_9GLOM|nr:hypothetical protein RclHR1_23600003 [Rhizophagus clarus]GES88001.1 kinase-like domain-containing protein [Rhizophagus clarus]
MEIFIVEIYFVFALIGDFGLCKPVIRSNNIDENTYGVLPYMAPEVLRGEPYTKAADIYSFGIIMWELTSGIPAFHNISHDFQLSLDICKGTRPEIIEGTMPEYVELMKRCWDNDPEKRPTAEELKNNSNEWFRKYSDIERVPVVGNQVFILANEPETKFHPNACYTSRKISYSARLNQYLAQDSLSDKIVIADDEIMSEDLDEFKV